jgi:hypothetical protein
MTVHIAIGNSDGQLSHEQWERYWNAVHELLAAEATRIHGVWHSIPPWRYVNACWAVEIEQARTDHVRAKLIELARAFGQDSIAWLEGETEFLSPPEDAGG